MTRARKPPKLRSSIWAILVVVACLGGILLWLQRLAASCLLGLAAALLLAVGLNPNLRRPVDQSWTWLAHLLATVLTHLSLAVTFYVVVAPVRLLLRAFGKQPLGMRAEQERSSYWEPPDGDGPWGGPTKPA